MTALQNKHYSGFCKATEEDCIKEYLAKKNTCRAVQQEEDGGSSIWYGSDKAQV